MKKRLVLFLIAILPFIFGFSIQHYQAQVIKMKKAAGGCSGSVGFACENLSSTGSDNSTTYVSQIAADCTGNITQIDFYREYGSGTITVALFTANGNDLTAVSGSQREVTITTVDGCKTLTSAGEDFAAISVTSGEYFGFYGEGNVKGDTGGSEGDGFWYYSGDQTECSEQTFDQDADGSVAIYGVITN